MSPNAAPFRLALIGFGRPGGNNPAGAVMEAALVEALARDERIEMIDRRMLQAALSGVGYDGSINMSVDEARRLGWAIGCDVFIVGKAEAIKRSERAGESHEEAIVAVMMVDGRRGRVVHFDFILERAASPEAALSAAATTLRGRARGYVDRIDDLRRARESLPPTRVPLRLSSVDRVEELPYEGSPAAAGFNPPTFLNRVKPEYTEQADRADVTATVEAMAVFHADGSVGEIDIVRWAGFGLDESAARAIRQLKFKPATRDGKPISVRALIRYNFRRVSQSDVNSPAQSKPEEKPERDLRELFKPRYRPPR
ncbi:MAG TPA: energy transducer TonB [Blastocatellia bacterium]|nr:energy transducer TonB [Blastocatellia bacterium]